MDKSFKQGVVSHQSFHTASLIVKLVQDLVKAAVFLSYQTFLRDARIVKEDLVKVHATANIYYRLNTNPGQAGLKKELANTSVFRGVWVGSGYKVNPVHAATAASPRLLTINDIIIAILNSPGFKRGEVRASVWLAHAQPNIGFAP
ncbi:hypothetical protein ES703_73134 [subsurface metagenome]